MAWSLAGTYFEICNCDAICPCTWSGFAEPATHDRCRVVLNYHIDRGAVDGVDVAGLTFALVADTPPAMLDGNWRVGVLLDDRATAAQAEGIGSVLSGQRGGPPAMLHPLIGEILGVQPLPVTYTEEGRRHRVRWGDVVAMELEDVYAGPQQEPVRLENLFHPSNSTLTVGKGVDARVTAFGIDFGQPGTSGASSPYTWSGE
ncbi:MAG TPA: DUF1326 domain-containing protein [Thermomicrobiaceae bacterium]|nr:DUF1326 domain-containing protein [Thermomicrobiaceae bacterium]